MRTGLRNAKYTSAKRKVQGKESVQKLQPSVATNVYHALHFVATNAVFLIVIIR